MNPATKPSVKFEQPIESTKGGRMKPVEHNINEPIDIDDDISDHGPESVAQQLRELDGMNKYLQNIRIPTSKFNIFS